jgi:ergothioneine biosynthesis protein EgtB
MSHPPFADHLLYEPHPHSALLDGWLTSANGLTRSILKKMRPGDESVAIDVNLNPPYWEFGHLTWFHEFWVHRGGQVSNPSLLSDADYLFNSSEIAHRDRWSIATPPFDILLEYNARVMQKTHELLVKSIDAEKAYFIQLSIFHQDMHNEAFAYMWQALGYPAPFEPFSQAKLTTNQAYSYIHFPKTNILIGAEHKSGFIFDNEKWSHSITLAAFNIAEQAVSNSDYLEFIESAANQADLNPVTPPVHWKKERGVWYQRYFNEWLDFAELEPVRHISYSDAKRYCDWRQLRLPNEHELSLLMSQKQNAWQPSHLWEWTDNLFLPFPGFSPDPYIDYSQPWFDGNYQVLKGWSMYTPERLRRSTFRNFYVPHRKDHFCGFRTCLL